MATASGTAVIASDAAHTFQNLQENKPFLILHNVPEYLDGFQKIRQLARQESMILPGHDGLVMDMHHRQAENIALLE